MDHEKCRLMCYKLGDETRCDNLGTEDLTAGNFSWVMTEDVTRCCFEVCSDQDCYSKKASIGINDCTSCKNDRDCGLDDRFNYWQLDFNILRIRATKGVKTVQVGMPLDCSIDCKLNDSSFGCSEKP